MSFWERIFGKGTPNIQKLRAKKLRELRICPLGHSPARTEIFNLNGVLDHIAKLIGTDTRDDGSVVRHTNTKHALEFGLKTTRTEGQYGKQQNSWDTHMTILCIQRISESEYYSYERTCVHRD